MTRLHCALKTCFTLSRKLCACGLCRYIYRRVELRACVCIPLSPVRVCVHAYMHTSASYGRVCVCVPLSISLQLVQVCVPLSVSLQLVQVRRCVDLCGTWLLCVSRCLASGSVCIPESVHSCYVKVWGCWGGKGDFWVTLVLRGQIHRAWIWTSSLCLPLPVLLTAAPSSRLPFLASH